MRLPRNPPIKLPIIHPKITLPIRPKIIPSNNSPPPITQPITPPIVAPIIGSLFSLKKVSPVIRPIIAPKNVPPTTIILITKASFN